LAKTFQPENSPFIIGLTAHPDIEPAQLPSLLAALEGFLLELRPQLPDTMVRMMLDGGNPLRPLIEPALLAHDLSVEVVDASQFDDVVIRCSSLLLALWNGQASSAPGDTADQVFRFLGVGGEQAAALNRVEISAAAHDLDVGAQLVFWVPATRTGDQAQPGPLQPYYLLSAGDQVLDVQPSMPSTLKRRLTDLNEYNLDFERFCADARLRRSESLLRPDSASMPMADIGTLQTIDRHYVKADSLAGYMQRQSDRLFNTFGIAAFAMGLVYLIYDKVTESRILLTIYILILVLSLLVYYFFQTKHWFKKYLSYRSLAETLRVRFYLALAGLDRRMQTRELIELTGIHQFPGFGWIGLALDAVESTEPAADIGEQELARRTHQVEQAWIEDQYRYFVRKVASMERHLSWIGRLKNGVFTTGLIVLSMMFLFAGALHHVDARTGLPLKNVVTFCSGCLAVVLGVWELRQNKMAVQELLWQYRNQLSQFRRARVQLQRTSIRARRDDILTQLGANSLMEIYLWAIHRYHREHKPPSAH
jgi:hypothetical protein